ncbi:hypothetical protein [Fonticella tunisiensis]|uniref:Uncharacterized protein n=1 Tax=Fonticella tunisiensis TaxID=1096341 RepID=A0A4V3ESS4_9CLOT|nr:hypothetical protein [Fonticella tunisiensis]TDT50918.1 hypothetical protein EDD71_12313 [Fonticella tunisiensis]
MIRLVCLSCGKEWYTANTSKDQRCDDCGGELLEKENEAKKRPLVNVVKDSDS